MVKIIESFLITSRETLEASLVIGIVMSYLNKTNNKQFKKTVYYGIIFGILFSVLAAIGFSFIAGGFTGKSEALFEGITMLIGAGLLTTMILWMRKQRNISFEIEEKVGQRIMQNNFYGHIGIFLIIFTAIIREGVETVIFLNALKYASGLNIISGLVGIVSAIIVGYLFFIGSKKMKLKYVFSISSILLIFFAAGLTAHGVHELEEASVIPVGKVLFDINHVVNEKGVFGSFLKGLFGYNGNPSLLEFSVWLLYLGIIFFFYFSASHTRLRRTS